MEEQQKSTHGSSRKKIIGIVCGIAVIALLAGAIVLLLRNPAESNEESSEAITTTLSPEEQAALQLSAQEGSAVQSITVANATGSYDVIRVQEATEETGAVFGIDGWEEVPLDTSVLGTLANNIASLTAEQLVTKNTADLEKYGLGEDAVRATLHFDDGSQFAFRVGNPAADSSMTYASVEGSQDVYLVRTSLVANYKKAATDFLSRVLLSELSGDNTPIIQTLTLERTNLETPIVLEHEEEADADDSSQSSGTAATHQMVSPIRSYLSVERSGDVITGLFGKTASQILQVQPTAAELEAAGVGETPFGKLTLDCDNGETYVLRIGSQTSGTDADGNPTTYYPVYLENSPLLYALDSASCPWATITPTGLASKLIFATYVWDLEQLDITTADGTEMAFENSGTDKASASVTLNGADVDAERYRQFYTFLLATEAEEVVTGDLPAGTPEAEVHYKTHNGKVEHTVSFYRADDFTCLIAMDGVLSFSCRAGYLDTFAYNVEHYNGAEPFRTVWQ